VFRRVKLTMLGQITTSALHARRRLRFSSATLSVITQMRR
jgi:hypothetical protein